MNPGHFAEGSNSEPEDALANPGSNWPAHGVEMVPWSQSMRGGSREDRMLSEIEASIPPFIADLDYLVPPKLINIITDAQSAVARLDAVHGPDLKPLAQLLTRTEAVSSSKIEGISATLDDYARATAGSKANASASSMVAAGEALTQLIERTGEYGTLSLDHILDAHLTLMRDDPMDGMYAGQLRTVQNWIGGSDYSPRGAVHIPPVPGRVEPLMHDLIIFANRNDIPAIPQAAIVHAQFESIHPFTDGNGRIGRAMINAVLRRRGVTKNLVIPIATAMVANRQGYFNLVNDYRAGEIDPFVRHLGIAALIASEESELTGANLRAIPTKWQELSQPRKGSAAASILNALPTTPVISSADAERIAGGTTSSAFTALERLETDGVIHEVTGRVRNRIYVASAIMDELSDLEVRIAQRVGQ